MQDYAGAQGLNRPRLSESFCYGCVVSASQLIFFFNSNTFPGSYLAEYELGPSMLTENHSFLLAMLSIGSILTYLLTLFVKHICALLKSEMTLRGSHIKMQYKTNPKHTHTKTPQQLYKNRNKIKDVNKNVKSEERALKNLHL